MRGYVEMESVEDEEWSYWAYLEKSNREWDMIRLEKQHRNTKRVREVDQVLVETMLYNTYAESVRSNGE